MNNRKNLTLDGMTLHHSILMVLVLCSIGVCLYLTKYYFDSHYPVSLIGGASFCDLSSFWNCDGATFSSFSNILGVPVSFFGLLCNLIFFMGSIFPSKEMEKTSSFVSKVNILGCLVFFSYSLIALGSLCPLCTLYYVLSGAIFYLYYTQGPSEWKPDFKILGLWTALAFIGSGIVFQYSKTKEAKQVAVNKQIIQQFFELPNKGLPNVESPFKLATANEQFDAAKIRISIFSDFQCPFCKVIAEQFHKIERLYKDDMNINYYFFPLDSECNDQLKRQIHPLACRASYLAACDKSKFKMIHDQIFANQENLTMEWLQNLQAEHGLTGCFENKEAKASVVEMIDQAKKFNVRSTPTLIINGVKIEGSLKTKQYIALFEEIIKRANQ